MRLRLVEATVASLAEDGYAGTTLSSIVRRAGVSRGAQVHHFPTKQALMLHTAEFLLRETYRDLGEVLLSITRADDRLEALVEDSWRTLFGTKRFTAYLELLAASQHDRNLADELQALLVRASDLYRPATDHYFRRRRQENAAPHLVFLQLCALLSGLAAHRHLVDDDQLISSQLRLWVEQTSRQLRARPVKDRPPLKHPPPS